MRFSLQQMVQRTLSEAEEREKTAQAEDVASEGSAEKKEKGKPPAKTPTENTATTPERNEDAMMGAEGEKTSSAFVEKLAAAVYHCNMQLFKGAAAPVSSPLGPAKGPNTIPTNAESPTPGKQSESTGQAKHNQLPLHPGSDPNSPGNCCPSTSMETDINDPPGGGEDWSEGGDKMKQAAVARQLWRERHGSNNNIKVARVQAVMNKMAANAELPAKIRGKNSDAPPPATQSEEGVPSLPGEAKKQEKLIMSLKSAIDYTKQQAKAVPKKRMGEVLSEPAQKKSTDPVLHENLAAASKAGVKLSSAARACAARSFLQKVAQEGESADATPEQKERASKLQEVLNSKKKEQEKNSQGMAPMEGGMAGDASGQQQQPFQGGY